MLTPHQSASHQVGESASKIAHRWGGEIRIFDRGFLSVPVRFLRGYAKGARPLSTSEAMLLLLVMTFKWGEDNPFPSYTRLARMMGVSPRMISRYASCLERKGYISRIRRRGTTNEFDLSPAFDRIGAMPVTRAEDRYRENLERLKNAENMDL